MVRNANAIKDSLFSNAIARGLLVFPFIQSRFGIHYAILASEMVSWEEILEALDKEGYLTTATLESNIEKCAAPFYSRHHATPSNVLLKFEWEIPQEQRSDVVIPFLQIVETVEENPKIYATLEQVTLFAVNPYIVVPAKSLSVGADSMVAAGELRIIEPSIGGIKVTNEQDSWGGTDDEPITDVRDNALSARYQFERGTETAIRLALTNLGLETYQYNLVDKAYGNGSFALWVDTTVDEYMDAIYETMEEMKAFGIYEVCEKAEPVSFDFSFIVKVSSLTDIMPAERNQLKKDVENSFREFILKNGVGKKIVISKAIHKIYEDLLNKYSLFDIHIEPLNFLERLDSDKNIRIENNEVVKVANVSIDIDSG